MATESFDELYNRALRFLSYRPRSEQEVIKNLLKKKAPEDIISKIISKLKENNFINDEEFVKWWAEQRIELKPRSLRLIKIELRQKGISEEIITQAIQNSELRIQNKVEEEAKRSEKVAKYLSGFTIKKVVYVEGRLINFVTN